MSDAPETPSNGPVVPRRTPEEITTLAREMIQNRYYIPPGPEAVDLSFGMLFKLNTGPMDWLKDVGLVYEEWALAQERSVNGYPVFFSMKMLHKDDLPFLQTEYKRMAEALGIDVAAEGANG